MAVGYQKIAVKALRWVNVEAAMDASLHIGHYIFDWQPSNKPFGLCFLDNNVIINVDVTLERLKRTLVFMSYLVSTTRRTSLLFVNSVPEPEDEGTFINQSTYLLKRLGYGYVLRWLPGYLSNLPSLIIEYWRNLPKLLYKKRKSRIQRALLKANYSGLRTLARFPDLVCFFSSAGPYEIGVKEVLKLEMPTILFGDTDVQPKNSAGWVPSNDDHITTMRYQVELFREALLRALKKTLFKEVSQFSKEIRLKPGLLSQFYEIKTATDRGLGVDMAKVTNSIIRKKRDRKVSKKKRPTSVKKTYQRNDKLPAGTFVLWCLASSLSGRNTRAHLNIKCEPSWRLAWGREEFKAIYKKPSRSKLRPRLKKTVMRRRSLLPIRVLKVKVRRQFIRELLVKKAAKKGLLVPVGGRGVGLGMTIKRIIARRKARAYLLSKSNRITTTSSSNQQVVVLKSKRKRSAALQFQQRAERRGFSKSYVNQLRKSLTSSVKLDKCRKHKMFGAKTIAVLRLATKQYLVSRKPKLKIGFYKLWGVIKRWYKVRGFSSIGGAYRHFNTGCWLKQKPSVVADVGRLKSLRQHLRKVTFQLVRIKTILRYRKRLKLAKIAAKLMGGHTPSSLVLIIQLILSGNGLDPKRFVRQQLRKSLTKLSTIGGIEQRAVLELIRKSKLGFGPSNKQRKSSGRYAKSTQHIPVSKKLFSSLRARNVLFRYKVSLGLAYLLNCTSSDLKLRAIRCELYRRLTNVRRLLVPLNLPSSSSKRKKRVTDHYKKDTGTVQNISRVMAWKLMAVKRNLYWRNYRRWVRRATLRRWRLGVASQLTTNNHYIPTKRKIKKAAQVTPTSRFAKKTSSQLFGIVDSSLPLLRVGSEVSKKNRTIANSQTPSVSRETKKKNVIYSRIKGSGLRVLDNKRVKGPISRFAIRLPFLASRKKFRRWLEKQSMGWIRDKLKLIISRVVKRRSGGVRWVSYLRSIVRSLSHQLTWLVKQPAGISSELWLKGLLVQGRALWGLAYLREYYLKRRLNKRTTRSKRQKQKKNKKKSKLTPTPVLANRGFAKRRKRRNWGRGGRLFTRSCKLNRQQRQRCLKRQQRQRRIWKACKSQLAAMAAKPFKNFKKGEETLSLRDFWLTSRNKFRFKVKVGSIVVRLWRLRHRWQCSKRFKLMTSNRFLLVNATSRLLSRGVVKLRTRGRARDKFGVVIRRSVKKNCRRRGYVGSKSMFRLCHYKFITDRPSAFEPLVNFSDQLARLRERVEVFGHGDWVRSKNRAPRLVVRFGGFGKRTPPQVRERYSLSKISDLVRSLAIVGSQRRNRDCFVWLAGIRHLLKPKKGLTLGASVRLSKVQVGFMVRYGTYSLQKALIKPSVLGAVKVVMRRLTWRCSVEKQSRVRWSKQDSGVSIRLKRWRRYLYNQQCASDRLLQSYSRLLKVLSVKISKSRQRLRFWTRQLGASVKKNRKLILRKRRGLRTRLRLPRRKVLLQTNMVRRIMFYSRKIRKLVAQYRRLLRLRAVRRNLISTRVFILMKVREKSEDAFEENTAVFGGSEVTDEGGGVVGGRVTSLRRCWLFRPWRVEQLTDSEVFDSFWRRATPLWVSNPLRKSIAARVANSNNQSEAAVISSRVKVKPLVGYRQLGASLVYSWRFGLSGRGYVPKLGQVGKLLGRREVIYRI